MPTSDNSSSGDERRQPAGEGASDADPGRLRVGAPQQADLVPRPEVRLTFAQEATRAAARALADPGLSKQISDSLKTYAEAQKSIKFASDDLLKSIRPKVDARALLEMVSPVHKAGALSELVRFASRIPNVDAWSVKNRALIASLTAPSINAARILSQSQLVDIKRLYPRHALLTSRLHELQNSSQIVAQLSAGTVAASATNRALSDALKATRLKMSVAATASQLYGAGSLPSLEAHEALLGKWHLRRGLSNKYWREPDERARLYVEAEVDAGLVEATPEIAVELIVSSGFAADVCEAACEGEVITIGSVSWAIRAGDLRDQARRAIEAIEEQLRGFITEKMELHAGPKWLLQRAPGGVHEKAKGLRALALQNGETEQRLAAFVDIGDLGSIVGRKDNWDGVFDAVFRNREKFLQDISVLATWRRPTMHSRPIDAVMLFELMAVGRRLSAQMEDDGAWKQVAESDI